MKLLRLTAAATALLLIDWKMKATGAVLDSDWATGQAAPSLNAQVVSSPTASRSALKLYLRPESHEAGSLLGQFEDFPNRFQKTAARRVWDRRLQLTWIVLPDPKFNDKGLRLDWNSARRLAAKLNARLPELSELKTLITSEADRGSDAFLDLAFFASSPHTRRYWTAERAGLWEPYHRTYVDFARPGWANTSMSEIYCVLLIARQP